MLSSNHLSYQKLNFNLYRKKLIVEVNIVLTHHGIEIKLVLM